MMIVKRSGWNSAYKTGDKENPVVIHTASKLADVIYLIPTILAKLWNFKEEKASATGHNEILKYTAHS